MKRFLLLVLLILPILKLQGQSLPTKLYLIKSMGQASGPFRFYTTLNPKQPIAIPTKGYLLVETDADSLGIISGPLTGDATYPTEDRQAPVYVKLERGQTYYFRFSTVASSPDVLVDEMSPRAFQLYQGLNGNNMQAKHYRLSHSTGVQQIP